ncbi:D-alanine--D-alanine ligase [Egibacter rhizosphaerae]|uniref:D-alanine--D-alanine ligase n=1 Tax=Egibacter rhizosphaerae TaxID=1670831 RepID=A0A411YFL0_9ACTN|nr:D-alanine--D-alanine ligase [Egibacter rhizosphaerae]QBI20008.1 D-alanine--D-alanine ligase [Egibacter rhizosphaerae]
MTGVAVVAGGLSLERDVSLRSGGRVADALTDRGHEVELLDLDSALVERLSEKTFDVVFLALHGKSGEDGTVQALLDLMGIPYTGPDATASAIAWDKGVFKGLSARHGIPTPDWVPVSSEAIRDLGAASALPRIIERLGSPLVVKPAQGGAFMGVRVVDGDDDLRAGLVSALSYYDVALAERFVRGSEVAIAILDGEALPAVEIVPKTGQYDFSARYTHGAADFYAPARLDDRTRGEAEQVALRAWELAGCRDITRADLIVDADGQPWLLELDTCPGMTETSLVPMAAEAAGIGFDELCERLVQLALRR